MRVFPEFQGPMAKWPRVEAMPRAKNTLATLWPTWVIGLGTNAADSSATDIREALAMVGLGVWVDRVYCRANTGHSKPSPEFFAHILTDLHLDASRVVMVGDTYEADILGARRVGMRAVWFNQRSTKTRSGRAIGTIHDLGDLERLLRLWRVGAEA